MNRRITALLCTVALFSIVLLSCGAGDGGIGAENAFIRDGIYVIAGETAAYDPDTFTEASFADSVEEPEPAEPEPTVLRILLVSTPVKVNRTARLAASGIPGVKYEIAVYYASGKSRAKGLSPRIANGNGVVEWTWKVGQRTKPGTYRITVTGGGETAETTFSVEE